MHKKIALIMFGLSIFIAILSAPLEASNSNSIQIKGSDTMVNLVQAWSEEFMKNDSSAFLAVTGGGSGTGLAALINGTCDIAASSRQIKAKEIELASKKGITPKEYSVALDGLAVVVHKGNPVTQLTRDQLAGIFSGKINNWKEVGGTDLKIVVLSREVNSGTHVYFKEHVLRKGDSSSKAEFAPEALLLPSSQAIADEVLQNPAAIGYYGMGYISKEHQVMAVALAPGTQPVAPSLENVTSGRYPISRPLFFYVNGEPSGLVKKFLDFCLSAEGQTLVATMDFVPLKAS